METRFNFHEKFTYLGLFFIGFNLLSTVLAICGLFYGGILGIFILVGIYFIIYWLFKNRSGILKIKPDYALISIALASLLTVFFFSHYSTPSIFSGRDQGSFSEAAIRLAENHQLSFSFSSEKEFFKIYGPGKALNFPGFDYLKDGRLITHFPVGYISWLAAFYSFFGLSGLIYANAVTFLVFLFSFYLLTRIYLAKSASIIVYLLIISSFTFSWFFKLTLSENLALAIVWFGVLEFVIFLKSERSFFLFASLFAFFVLAFTRIETFAFLVAILVISLALGKIRPSHFKKIILEHKLFSIILGLTIFFYLINIYTNWAYYLTFLKGFLGSFDKDELSSGQSSWSSLLYILKVLNAYALLDSLIIFGLAVFYALYKKKYAALVPFFTVSVTFIYFLHPGISFDHPWLLRRFLFSIIPASFFYAIWFLDSFFKRKVYFYVFSLLMIANNLATSVPHLTFSQNKSLEAQVKTISDNFQKSDLVLIDQKATGDGFSMMSGPMNFLYDLQAVYFLNPSDIEKIDLDKFQNIYFIIPDSSLSMYQNSFLFDKLLFQKDYRIETESLNILDRKKGDLLDLPVELPKRQALLTEGKIYLLKK